MSRFSVFILLLCSSLCGIVSCQGGNACVSAGGSLWSTCAQEIQAVNGIYPLNSQQPITDSQVTQILGVAQQSGLPTQRCCQAAQRFAQNRCSCDTLLPPLLAAVGVNVTPVGLQSADKFTSQACNFPPTTC